MIDYCSTCHSKIKSRTTSVKYYLWFILFTLSVKQKVRIVVCKATVLFSLQLDHIIASLRFIRPSLFRTTKLEDESHDSFNPSSSRSRSIRSWQRTPVVQEPSSLAIFVERCLLAWFFLPQTRDRETFNVAPRSLCDCSWKGTQSKAKKKRIYRPIFPLSAAVTRQPYFESSIIYSLIHPSVRQLFLLFRRCRVFAACLPFPGAIFQSTRSSGRH
jgi:hypothetical protein